MYSMFYVIYLIHTYSKSQIITPPPAHNTLTQYPFSILLIMVRLTTLTSQAQCLLYSLEAEHDVGN